ncbi:hypothetical protein A3A14_02000 [Candidatus Daviesbacteria bacterium RIFCSPLOWO2_01_FULL_43_38]|uniref:Uncharacterized protein n=1 Tax=Candidatus Daviesbacteria bacterium RIFCSPHIGHO2_12_FULL_43_11 TaxID=1797780 RepID=A0A1F5K868_9BACT|nr:MAG: hypothetical protein A2874_02760 [Candidatus Daviesbacteria bacterium RIFCSPHIGHO2_01_FULL_43_17]OGE36970.1 MAG: hypothetical protein A3E45_01875 [Candidatus Daviesbacteria bacterium RIFCSPHIGHO2_12_FULL_43_11]OGE63627.1 MAG: hypothetical protein A3A14_02000 [Candidatus Daviesbacteria bacterium RIFCSPLOWO2_01_FULL_43_38]
MKDKRGLVEVRVLVGERLVPTRGYTHWGKTYIEAKMGQRFAVEVRNLTAGPIEVVMAVDGLDIQDGKIASLGKAGFVIGWYKDHLFEGFRMPQQDVAEFRFGALDASYATLMDTPNNIGVIGIAVFQEKERFHFRESEPDVLDELLDSFVPISTPTPTVEPTRTLTPDMLIGARPDGLGTMAGERRRERVAPTSFERLTLLPAAEITLRYRDRAILESLGIRVVDLPGSLARREEAQLFPNSRFK